MAPRPHWKGYLKLSLVSCPIALYPAISAAERISMRQVNKRTGHRLRQQMVDAVTGEVVASPDKGRGYEVGENEFLMVEDHDIAQARQARPLPGAVELVPASAPGASFRSACRPLRRYPTPTQKMTRTRKRRRNCTKW